MAMTTKRDMLTFQAFAVKEGDHVKRGQVIGYVGNTGNSVSSHLHYEVLYKGRSC